MLIGKKTIHITMLEYCKSYKNKPNNIIVLRVLTTLNINIYKQSLSVKEISDVR
jgi:hypothetical protein